MLCSHPIKHVYQNKDLKKLLDTHPQDVFYRSFLSRDAHRSVRFPVKWSLGSYFDLFKFLKHHVPMVQSIRSKACSEKCRNMHVFRT